MLRMSSVYRLALGQPLPLLAWSCLAVSSTPVWHGVVLIKTLHNVPSRELAAAACVPSRNF